MTTLQRQTDDRIDLAKFDGKGLSEILALLMGKTFLCPACGQTHSMTTRRICLEDGLGDNLEKDFRALGFSGKVLIVADRNTDPVAGSLLERALKGFSPRRFVFDREELHADSASIGRLLIAMSGNPDFLVSCGSGTITDTVRYTALLTGKPFAAFGTAASMDGYASSSTPLIVDGFKTTYPGCAPRGIFADTRILSNAPRRMTAAGFGDVLAKIVALMDWKLAFAVEEEPYCPLIAALVSRAVDECILLSDKLADADPAACGKLMEVLSLTGIAMQMMGTSRPASGAEHHISHLLEMRDIQQGKTGSLHGDKVGIGTLISLYMYYRLFGDGMPIQKETLPADTWESEVRRVYGSLADEAIARNAPEPPKGVEWEKQKHILEQSMKETGFDFVRKIPRLLPRFKAMIEKMGGPVYPHQLGYTVSDTYDAIAHGKEVRPKFTLLRIAERYGHLYELAEEIAKGLPEGRIY
jgi:glycerol-1-phosphate dehydrogenase [NAD(P)+]